MPSVLRYSCGLIVVLFCNSVGCDGGGRAHSDGRGVRRRGWAPDHTAGEHTVRRCQWHRWRGQLQQLSGAGLQLALEQQGSFQPGEQERQPHLTGITVEPRAPHPQPNPSLSLLGPHPTSIAMTATVTVHHLLSNPNTTVALRFKHR